MLTHTLSVVYHLLTHMVDVISNALKMAAEHLLLKNMSDNTSDDYELTSNDDYFYEDDQHALLTLVLMTIVYSLLFLTGVVGNVCTCVVIARNRYMHTATNYYLFSLAISDLLLLVVSLPQEMYELWVPYPYALGEFMCVTRGFTAETSTYASILTITAFTAERYIAICHPLKSHKWSSLSRAVKVIVVVWAISALFAVPVSFQFGVLHLKTEAGEDVTGTAVCTLKNRLRHAFLISSLLFFFVPQVVIFLLYVKIGLRLRLPIPLGKAEDSSSTKSLAETNSFKREKKRRISINSNRKGIIKMLVAVVVSFFFCWLPFHTQRLMADYVRNPTPLFDTLYSVVRHISGVTYYLSPTVNPILYQVMSLKFQQAFKDTFGPFSRCLRGEPQPGELAHVTNINTECTQASTRIRRSPFGSPQTTAFNI